MNATRPGGELPAVASLLLLVLIVAGSFGGFVAIRYWRLTQYQARATSNLKQLRLSIQQYDSRSVANPVSQQ